MPSRALTWGARGSQDAFASGDRLDDVLRGRIVNRRHSARVEHLGDVEDAPRWPLLRVRQQVSCARVTEQLARFVIAVRVLLLNEPTELALQLGHDLVGEKSGLTGESDFPDVRALVLMEEGQPREADADGAGLHEQDLVDGHALFDDDVVGWV